MLPLVLAIAVLILASGLTSMTEAAVLSAPLGKIEVAVREKRRGARRLRRIKEHLHRPLSALLILNNAINIGGSIFVGFLAESVFADRWLAAFTAGLTFLVIVFAEIIPKTLGERFSTTVGLFAAPILLIITGVLSPIIWVIERISKPFAGGGASPFPSEEEISALVHLGREGGEISSHEWEMIRHVFHLNDVSARDIMTHRLKLSTLSGSLRLADLKMDEIDMTYSRILVTENGDIDKVTGVVYLRDLLATLARGETDGRTVDDIKKSVLFVYESTPAHRLLQQFQRARQHLFVVVDEYGGTQGVVTLEDVLEQIVGEILDETDPVPEPGIGTSPSLAVERATGSPPRRPPDASAPRSGSEGASPPEPSDRPTPTRDTRAQETQGDHARTSGVESGERAGDESRGSSTHESSRSASENGHAGTLPPRGARSPIGESRR